MNFVFHLHGKGWKHTTKIMEMPMYMKWLQSRFLALGGTREQKRLNAINDLAQYLSEQRRRCDVVVLCSGLGARSLMNDMSVFPMKGQIVKVLANLTTCYVGEGVYEHPSYILPRTQVAVLGGSGLKNVWDVNVDDNMTKDILKRCEELLPGISRNPIVDISCCLRPCREKGLRLEIAQQLTISNTAVPVVANYGHGGCGPTLSWGCAKAVSEFADEFHRMNRSKL